MASTSPEFAADSNSRGEDVAEKDSILSQCVMPFNDEYDVCVKAVNDFLDKKNSKQTTKKENTNMTTKLNDEMIKELNREIRAFNKTITSSTTNKEIWNKKLELSKKYGINIIGHYVSEDEYDCYGKYQQKTALKNRAQIFVFAEEREEENENY